ncbi:HPr family phosphocarrier protein [Halobium salinum]|uniref:HPr family phosphocarrier protein n=1 Tax=Halobium salinum TaxID=1364940 RepID=A0ABD5PCY4_9EURY|nr:HPr family phosphocarrier protein [Halobium salinum]
MERVVTVVPEEGLHARPASKFVSTANEYDSEVRVGRAGDGNTVPANSMLAVTGLDVRGGEDVLIIADGEDAEAALDALESLLSSPVEEDADG